MRWFNHKSKSEPIVLTPPATSRVEIELHKGASEEAAKKAKLTNQHLSELLLKNGFTLKLFLAAGGPAPSRGNKR